MPANESASGLTDQIDQLLRIDITSGVLAPGSPLRIPLLTKRYESGPTPVREALSRLLPDGLVEFTPNRGFRVRGISRDDLLDITATRIAVETEALRLSMDEATDDWASGIVAAQYRLSLLLARHGDEWNRTNIEPAHLDLHRALIAGCRSPRLLTLADKLAKEHSRYIFLAHPVASGSPSASSAREDPARAQFERAHDELIEIVLQGDSERASDALRAHLRLVVEILDEIHFWDTWHYPG